MSHYDLNKSFRRLCGKKGVELIQYYISSVAGRAMGPYVFTRACELFLHRAELHVRDNIIDREVFGEDRQREREIFEAFKRLYNDGWRIGHGQEHAEEEFKRLGIGVSPYDVIAQVRSDVVDMFISVTYDELEVVKDTPKNNIPRDLSDKVFELVKATVEHIDNKDDIDLSDTVTDMWRSLPHEIRHMIVDASNKYEGRDTDVDDVIRSGQIAQVLDIKESEMDNEEAQTDEQKSGQIEAVMDRMLRIIAEYELDPRDRSNDRETAERYRKGRR